VRMIMNLTFPVEPFNSLVRDGRIGELMGRLVEALQPESIYFTEEDGHRGATAVIDVADVSQIPVLAEPWFLTLNAECRFRIAMTPDDLQKAGLDALGKAWG
jgi:hypothetical protein